MKKILILSAVFLVLLGVLAFFSCRNDALRKENTRLKSNLETTLTENTVLTAESQKYRISDSLNAARVTALELSLSEFKKLKQEDLETIRKLNINNKDLQSIITSQNETILRLKTQAKDTVRLDPETGIKDSLKYFIYNSRWTDVYGFVSLITDSVDLNIKNRESLKVIETIQYKRFLGFLWRTHKVESRKVDVISENPATSIVKISYTNIGK